MRRRRTFDLEFKRTIVDLLESGKTAKELFEEYSIKPSTIFRWRREFESGKLSETVDFKSSTLSKEESELRALRKELRDVTMERDILKKAVSIFSKSDS